jgi:hypothetical protein
MQWFDVDVHVFFVAEMYPAAKYQENDGGWEIVPDKDTGQASVHA